LYVLLVFNFIFHTSLSVLYVYYWQLLVHLQTVVQLISEQSGENRAIPLQTVAE